MNIEYHNGDAYTANKQERENKFEFKILCIFEGGKGGRRKHDKFFPSVSNS